MPRFAWNWAPDQPAFTYSLDDRTVLKKSWADWPGPDGKPIGRAWVLSEWRINKSVDHCGYGSGARVAVARAAGYAPYFETAVGYGLMPSEGLNQNYIWAIGKQLSVSAQYNKNSMDYHLAEEKWTSDHNNQIAAKEHLERSRAVYDNHTGAFGNLEPGKRDGYFSFQNDESGFFKKKGA
jgi:hypothetical protein